jgi:UDPglucose 6-dehydrogenase
MLRDINSNKIDNLNKGIISIYEPSLKEMITRNMKKRRLNFTTLKRHCNILKFYFCRNSADEDGSADLKYVLTVARDSRKHLNDHMLVVTENAVPVGTFKRKENARGAR